MRTPICLLLVSALAGPPPEPPPRRPDHVPLNIGIPLTHVSAAHELPDGRIVATNALQPSVVLIDPVNGTVHTLGEAGGGPSRYARPGGLYRGPDGTTLLLDRGQTRVFTISPRGELQESRSIARRGVTVSADADIDLQRLDSRGLVYFTERSGGRGAVLSVPSESTLIRFDARSQTAERVATLRLPESRTIPAGDGIVISRSFIGSPADGWGVAPDGRIAIVRAAPYRVEWLAPDGKVTQGPVVEYTPLPMTEADRQHHAKSIGGVGAGVGRPGEALNSGNMDLLFAPTKPPFDPEDVLVAPDGRVWVLRSRPLDAKTVVYDLFDRTGARRDRIELPGGSRIVGFGRGSIFVRATANGGQCELRKYRL